jgi:hypothetical protein
MDRKLDDSLCCWKGIHVLGMGSNVKAAGGGGVLLSFDDMAGGSMRGVLKDHVNGVGGSTSTRLCSGSRRVSTVAEILLSFHPVFPVFRSQQTGGMVRAKANALNPDGFFALCVSRWDYYLGAGPPAPHNLCTVFWCPLLEIPNPLKGFVDTAGYLLIALSSMDPSSGSEAGGQDRVRRLENELKTLRRELWDQK